MGIDRGNAGFAFLGGGEDCGGTWRRVWGASGDGHCGVSVRWQWMVRGCRGCTGEAIVGVGVRFCILEFGCGDFETLVRVFGVRVRYICGVLSCR